MPDTKAEIKQLIETYFTRQSDFDGDGMLDFWHPAGRMYLVGNQGDFRVVTIEEQAGHIKQAKAHRADLRVEFVLEEIDQIRVHDDLIASVHVSYRMVFPEGYGTHRCFYHLANMDGKWGIVNAVDRGIQVTDEA